MIISVTNVMSANKRVSQYKRATMLTYLQVLDILPTRARVLHFAMDEWVFLTSRVSALVHESASTRFVPPDMFTNGVRPPDTLNMGLTRCLRVGVVICHPMVSTVLRRRAALGFVSGLERSGAQNVAIYGQGRAGQGNGERQRVNGRRVYKAYNGVATQFGFHLNGLRVGVQVVIIIADDVFAALRMRALILRRLNLINGGRALILLYGAAASVSFLYPRVVVRPFQTVLIIAIIRRQVTGQVTGQVRAALHVSQQAIRVGLSVLHLRLSELVLRVFRVSLTVGVPNTINVGRGKIDHLVLGPHFGRVLLLL